MSETVSSDAPIYCGPECPEVDFFEQVAGLRRALSVSAEKIVDKAVEVGTSAELPDERARAGAAIKATSELMGKTNRFQNGMDAAAEAVREIPCDPEECPAVCPRVEQYRAAFALAFRPPQA